MCLHDDILVEKKKVEHEYVRSYQVSFDHVNNVKMSRLEDNLKDYRLLVQYFIDKMYLSILYTGKFPKKGYKENIIYEINDFILDLGYSTHDTNKFLARHQLNCYAKASGMMSTWFGQVIDAVATTIKNSSLDEKEKIRLFKLNRSSKWHEDRFLYKIFRNVLKRFNIPSTKNLHMNLNVNVSEMQVSKKINGEFEYWLKIMDFKQGNNIIYLPIESNKYIDSKMEDGITFNGACEIMFDRGRIILTGKKKGDKIDINSNTVLGIDFGLRNLFTVDDGNIFGQGLLKKLISMDKEVQRLEKLSKLNKIPLSKNKKYKKAVHKMKEFLKNEVNRCINRIMKMYNPKKIVVENLNFVDSKMSKQLNRIIRNSGLSEINNKFSRLQEEYDIIVDYVNPAFTSQECSLCGFIDEENRKGKIFKCIKCGLKLNADVNASRTIKGRSVKGIDAKIKYKNRRQIKAFINDLNGHSNEFNGYEGYPSQNVSKETNSKKSKNPKKG